MDPGKKATAFLENTVTVGGEVHNKERVRLYCSLSTSPRKTVTLSRCPRKEVMTPIVLMVPLTFTFVLWKANIAPPALPLPEKSHARLGALLSRVRCWDQTHRWATGAQLGFTA